MKTQIITDNEIDEELAEDWLKAAYGAIDLLPLTPEKLSEPMAAFVLKVSEPTIRRMVQDGQIKLEKQAILNYINQKMLVNRPLNLTENTPK